MYSKIVLKPGSWIRTIFTIFLRSCIKTCFLRFVTSSKRMGPPPTAWKTKSPATTNTATCWSRTNLTSTVIGSRGRPRASSTWTWGRPAVPSYSSPTTASSVRWAGGAPSRPSTISSAWLTGTGINLATQFSSHDQINQAFIFLIQEFGHWARLIFVLFPLLFTGFIKSMKTQFGRIRPGDRVSLGWDLSSRRLSFTESPLPSEKVREG